MNWTAFLVYALSTAATPGPNNILSMSNGSRKGFLKALPFFHGQTGKLLLFALLLAFIGFVFTLLWSAFGSAFRILFSRHARAVNSVMALLLMYCALALFLG
ncbi:MAG: hypothetical protein GX171_10060 [Clostridiales bacterium]|jgi:threonine/homoserine/homoserine lactone efflux protein|nr:hypothetical protein [Clostridiales bacterium]